MSGHRRNETYGELFRAPGFTPLVVSGLFERTATQIFAVLLVLFSLNVYDSPKLSGLVVLTSQLPGLIVSPYAGALLDRGYLTRVITIDYTLAGLSIVVIGILALIHALPAVVLLVLVGIGSFFQPICRIGGRPLYPVIVPRELWDRSNAIDSGGFVVASVLGPAFAGIAFGVVGPRWALFVPALLMLAGAVLIGRVKLAPATRTSSGTLTREALGALRYVFGNRVIRMVAGTLTAVNVAVGGVNVMIAVLVKYRLHGGGVGTGFLLAVTGIAAFAAGLVIARHGTEGREKRVIAASCAVVAGGLVILAFSSDYVIAALGMAVTGAGNGPLSVAMMSLRARATDPVWFGRAFGVSINMNFAGVPLGAALAGILTADHHTAVAFLAGAACVALGGLWPSVLPASTYGARPSTETNVVRTPSNREEHGVTEDPPGAPAA